MVGFGRFGSKNDGGNFEVYNENDFHSKKIKIDAMKSSLQYPMTMNFN